MKFDACILLESNIYIYETGYLYFVKQADGLIS